MVTVVRLHFVEPKTLADDVLKLGYLLEAEEKAREYVEWRQGYIDKIESRVSAIPPEDRPKVFIDSGQTRGGPSERLTCAKGTGNHEMCEMAGGINIAAEPPGRFLAPGFPYVSLEWILTQATEVIIGQASGLNTREGGHEKGGQ